MIRAVTAILGKRELAQQHRGSLQTDFSGTGRFWTEHPPWHSTEYCAKQCG